MLYDQGFRPPLRLAQERVTGRRGVPPFMMKSMKLCLLVCLAASLLHAQVIEFESNGLRYKTLTKSGLTIMFAYLPAHLKEYSIVQVSISNGSPVSWVVKPEDFSYRRQDGTTSQASPAL